MKRYLITNPSFTGQAELIYDDQGVLRKLDATDTSMTAKMVGRFKNVAPIFQDELTSAFSAETTITESSFEVTFEMFWKSYDRKINKSRCMLLWSKMETSMHAQAYFGITAYNRFLKKESWGRNKADPETYLRNRYWENEYK